MNHDAIAVQICRGAGLPDDKIDALLTRLTAKPTAPARPAFTGRDLYKAHALMRFPPLPEWCELDDIEQADWNRRAKECQL